MSLSDINIENCSVICFSLILNINIEHIAYSTANQSFKDKVPTVQFRKIKCFFPKALQEHKILYLHQ